MEKPMPKPYCPVATVSSDEEIEMAFKPIPRWTLVSSDGREFAIRDYSVRISKGESVIATIEAIIKVPQGGGE
jgi:hypothetical protein